VTSRLLILGIVDKGLLGFVFNEAGISIIPEPPMDLRGIEEALISDGKEMGVDVVLVYFKVRIGKNADFEAAFHFDSVLSP